MKNVLLFDTCSRAFAAGLFWQGDWFEKKSYRKKYGDLSIAQEIDSLLWKAEAEIKKLDAIAVGVGPGSFTGIRSGLSIAKGLAYVLRCPLYPFNTLEAISQQAIKERFLQLVVLNSKRSFFGSFFFKGEKLIEDDDFEKDTLKKWLEKRMERISSPTFIPREKITPSGKSFSRWDLPLQITGEGCVEEANYFSSLPALQLGREEQAFPHLKHLAKLIRWGKKGSGVTGRALFSLRPHYLHAPKAQLKK